MKVNNFMKKKYTKKQIQEAIKFWEKQLKAGNYKKINESINLSENADAYKLIAAMDNGEAEFSYRTTDGSIRKARGTRVGHGKAPFTRKGYVSYYDLDKNGWRMFGIDSVTADVNAEPPTSQSTSDASNSDWPKESAPNKDLVKYIEAHIRIKKAYKNYAYWDRKCEDLVDRRVKHNIPRYDNAAEKAWDEYIKVKDDEQQNINKGIDTVKALVSNVFPNFDGVKGVGYFTLSIKNRVFFYAKSNTAKGVLIRDDGKVPNSLNKIFNSLDEMTDALNAYQKQFPKRDIKPIFK